MHQQADKEQLLSGRQRKWRFLSDRSPWCWLLICLVVGTTLCLLASSGTPRTAPKPEPESEPQPAPTQLLRSSEPLAPDTSPPPPPPLTSPPPPRARARSISRARGSTRLDLDELKALPRHQISSDEAKEIFLMRPNWRRADSSRKPYVYRGIGADGHFDEAAFEAAKAELQGEDLDAKSSFTFHNDRGEEGAFVENINAKEVSDTEDEKIRVFFLMYTTRTDIFFCNFVSTAYLSSIPINVVGYRHQHNNFTDKVWEMQRAAHRAGLRPRDVIVFYDSDIMFYSGQELSRSIDRFIRYSPESPEELDARDVRDDAGEMIAPLVFSGEHNCFYYDLFGPPIPACESRSREYALNKWESYMKTTFPGKDQFRDPSEFMNRFLNSGGIITRMWAWDEYTESFRRFVRGGQPVVPTDENQGLGWIRDQSVAAGLWMTQLKHEAAIDIFHPKDYTDTSKPPVYPRDKFGTRPGLIAIDYWNEWFTQVHTNAHFAKLNDRYLQAKAMAVSGRFDPSNADGVMTWMALEAETAAAFPLSFSPKSEWLSKLGGGTPANAGPGEPFTLEVSRRFFARRTSRNSGLENADGKLKGIRERVVMREFVPYQGHCIVDAFYQVNSGVAPAAAADALVVKALKRTVDERQRLVRKVKRRERRAAKKTYTAYLRLREADKAFRVARANNNVTLSERKSLTAARRALKRERGHLSRTAALFTAAKLSVTDASVALAAAPPMPESTDFKCYNFPRDRCEPCRRIDWFARPRPVAEEGRTLNLFTEQPLYLSRSKEVTSLLVAPPILLVALFYDPHDASEMKPHVGMRHMMYETPPTVHTPGARRKVPLRQSVFYMAPWAIPLFYGVENQTSLHNPEKGLENVKKFLASTRLQLWGEDFRTTKPYGNVCMNYVNEWFMNRKKRAVKHPWPV